MQKSYFSLVFSLGKYGFVCFDVQIVSNFVVDATVANVRWRKATMPVHAEMWSRKAASGTVEDGGHVWLFKFLTFNHLFNRKAWAFDIYLIVEILAFEYLQMLFILYDFFIEKNVFKVGKKNNGKRTLPK